MTVTLGVYYRREARAYLLSLHMGHCIVMGEALLVVVVPQEAPRIGTYSHFKMSCLASPRACRTCLSSTSKMLKQRTRRRGSCYMPTRDVTGLPKKTESKDKSEHGPKVRKVAPCCTSLFYGRTQKTIR